MLPMRVGLRFLSGKVMLLMGLNLLETSSGRQLDTLEHRWKACGVNWDFYDYSTQPTLNRKIFLGETTGFFWAASLKFERRRDTVSRGQTQLS